MKAALGHLWRRAAARLVNAARDTGARCHQCGVCHNLCALMGRRPGWIHRQGARSGEGSGPAMAAGAMPGAPTYDVKAQED